MSSGKLIAEYTTASSKIESDATQITNVSSKLSTHPNPKSAEEMGKLIKSRTQEVLDAWTSVYERQKKIFVWPSELQEDFLSQFRDKTPIELTVQFPRSLRLKARSGNVTSCISAKCCGIAEIAKTKWTASFEKTAGAGGMDASAYGAPSGFDPTGQGQMNLPALSTTVRWWFGTPAANSDYLKICSLGVGACPARWMCCTRKRTYGFFVR